MKEAGAAQRRAGHPVRGRHRPRLGARGHDAAAAGSAARAGHRRQRISWCAASCRRPWPDGRVLRIAALPVFLKTYIDRLTFSLHRLSAQREGFIDRAAFHTLHTAWLILSLSWKFFWRAIQRCHATVLTVAARRIVRFGQMSMTLNDLDVARPIRAPNGHPGSFPADRTTRSSAAWARHADRSTVPHPGVRLREADERVRASRPMPSRSDQHISESVFDYDARVTFQTLLRTRCAGSREAEGEASFAHTCPGS